MRRRVALALVAVLAAPLAFVLLAPLFYWRAASRFAEYSTREPSRLYGRAAVLRVGDRLTVEQLADRLRAEGFVRAVSSAELRPGDIAVPSAGAVLIRQRGLVMTASSVPVELVRVVFDGERIAELRADERRVDEIELEPPLIASYYGPQLRERRAVSLERLPAHLVQAVLAAEDDRYFAHRGVSPSAMLRAALVNIGAGEIRQGGSTITQQLARSLYLSRERSWVRKYREAMLSLALEMRYSKSALLEAYLNEVYLGSRGGVELLGVGAAAQAYFGKPAEALTLGESAMIAGILRSPGRYSPVLRPWSARERRDQVLRRMADLGWIDPSQARAQVALPLTVASPPPAAPAAGWFAEAAGLEARRRFGVGELAENGYSLFSTLDLRDQNRAMRAVAAGLDEKARGGAELEAALVSLDPSDGAILAYVGGRDYMANSFDRASRARRQAGSAFKPVVFAAALAAGANPTDQLQDSPIMVALPGGEWRPHNDDGTFRGIVTVRESLERSLNIPAVRLALATGTESVAALATRMGVAPDFETGPSLALGALDVTPLEMATVYGTLAAGGVRKQPYTLTRVLDARGVVVPGAETAAPARALDGETSFLVTAMLQGVLTRGTGGGVRRAGLEDPLAGKTGTSDEGRDAWFAGYSPGRVAVVWVGRDDNAPAKLSGSRHALPIWTDFMRAVRPAGGYPPPLLPDGVVSAEVDPGTRYLATPYCPQRSRDFFYASRVPVFQCPLHGGPMLANVPLPAADQPSFTTLTSAAASGSGVVILTGGAAPAESASWIAMPPPPAAAERP